MFVSRLEAEDNQAREMARAEAQRVAKASAEERARELTRAQELEVKAMERYSAYTTARPGWLKGK